MHCRAGDPGARGRHLLAVCARDLDQRGHHRRRPVDAGRLCPVHHDRHRRDDGDRRLWRRGPRGACECSVSRGARSCNFSRRHCRSRAGGAGSSLSQPQPRDDHPGLPGRRDHRSAREQGSHRRRGRPQRTCPGDIRLFVRQRRAFPSAVRPAGGNHHPAIGHSSRRTVRQEPASGRIERECGSRIRDRRATLFDRGLRLELGCDRIRRRDFGTSFPHHRPRQLRHSGVDFRVGLSDHRRHGLDLGRFGGWRRAPHHSGIAAPACRLHRVDVLRAGGGDAHLFPERHRFCRPAAAAAQRGESGSGNAGYSCCAGRRAAVGDRDGRRHVRAAAGLRCADSSDRVRSQILRGPARGRRGVAVRVRARAAWADGAQWRREDDPVQHRVRLHSGGCRPCGVRRRTTRYRSGRAANFARTDPHLPTCGGVPASFLPRQRRHRAGAEWCLAGDGAQRRRRFRFGRHACRTAGGASGPGRSRTWRTIAR